MARLARTRTHLDAARLFLRRKNFTIVLFLLLYAAAKTLLYLDDHIGTVLPREMILIMSGLPAIFFTLFFANVVIRVVSPLLLRFFDGELEPEQRTLFAKLVELLIYGLAIAFILYSFGVTMSSLALVIGFISGGLAFALREPVLSFIIWLLVLNKKPMRIGDWIRIGVYEGKVERIGTMYLTLRPCTRQVDDARMVEHIVKIPNKMLIEQTFENYGAGLQRHILRFQLRKRPTRIDALMRDVARTVRTALARGTLGSDVAVRLELQNTPAVDKHYIVLTFASPAGMREIARSEAQLAVLKKYATQFFEN